MAQIKVYPNLQEWVEASVDLFITLSEEAIQQRGVFSAALSGGGTPEPLYQALGRAENQKHLAWEKIHLFWGDERHVPVDHPDSNFKMVAQQLLEKVDIPEENVHRVPAEMEIRMAAFSYEEQLRLFFEGEWPQFDLVLLGMGSDGHTASLFPHSAGLNEEYRWFIANYAPKRESWRLTLTKNAINAARTIVILVRGQSKSAMMANVLTGDHHPEETPIQLISPVDGEEIWLLDSDSASQLPPELL